MVVQSGYGSINSVRQTPARAECPDHGADSAVVEPIYIGLQSWKASTIYNELDVAGRYKKYQHPLLDAQCQICLIKASAEVYAGYGV